MSKGTQAIVDDSVVFALQHIDYPSRYLLAVHGGSEYIMCSLHYAAIDTIRTDAKLVEHADIVSFHVSAAPSRYLDIDGDFVDRCPVVAPVEFQS